MTTLRFAKSCHFARDTLEPADFLEKIFSFSLTLSGKFFQKNQKTSQKNSEVPKFFSDFVSKKFPRRENFFEKNPRKNSFCGEVFADLGALPLKPFCCFFFSTLKIFSSAFRKILKFIYESATVLAIFFAGSADYFERLSAPFASRAAKIFGAVRCNL